MPQPAPTTVANNPNPSTGVLDTMTVVPDDNIATSMGEVAIEAVKPVSAPTRQPVL